MSRVLKPHEVRALCQLIWGEHGAWREMAAHTLRVSKRRFDYWVSEHDPRPPPEGIYDDLMRLAGEKLCDPGNRNRMWRQFQRRQEDLQLLNVALNQGPRRGEPVADTIG